MGGGGGMAGRLALREGFSWSGINPFYCTIQCWGSHSLISGTDSCQINCTCGHRIPYIKVRMQWAESFISWPVCWGGTACLIDFGSRARQPTFIYTQVKAQRASSAIGTTHDEIRWCLNRALYVVWIISIVASKRGWEAPCHFPRGWSC